MRDIWQIIGSDEPSPTVWKSLWYLKLILDLWMRKAMFYSQSNVVYSTINIHIGIPTHVVSFIRSLEKASDA